MLSNAAAMVKTSDQESLYAEIEKLLLEFPENDDRGRLRGACLRLRRAIGDAARFEAEFRKLAALSEKIAQQNAAVRLSRLMKEHLRRSSPGG